MTKIEKYLDEVRERERAASPAPWWAGPDGYILGPNPRRPTNRTIAEYCSGFPSDQEFLAQSRQDIPRLLRLVDGLRKAIEDAPHYLGCRAHCTYTTDGPEITGKCDCWKARAMEYGGENV